MIPNESNQILLYLQKIVNQIDAILFTENS